MQIMRKGVDMMSISCNCSVDIDEVAEFCDESYPKARKEHICCECREVIGKGRKYQLITGKWEGEFGTFKTCMACAAIRKHYCPNGAFFEELRNHLIECLWFDYTEVPEEDD